MSQIRRLFLRFLGFIERRTQVDMKYITEGSLWATLRFAVGIAGSVATTIAFGNLLPRASYGTYSYLLSLAGTLSFLMLSGVSTGVIRAVARGKEKVVPYAVKLQLRYNILAMLTVLAAALYYGFKGNSLFLLSLIILAITIPVSSAYFTYESVLIGKKKFDLLTKVTAISTLLGAIATVITIALTDNVLIIILVYGLASVVPNYFIYKHVGRGLDKTEPEENDIQELRETSFHLTGAGLISSLAQYLDKIVLFQAAGPAAVAVYGFSIAGPEKLKGLIKNWTSIALPRLAERSHKEIRPLFYKRFLYLFLVGIGLSLAYIILAPILFKLVLPKYLDAVPYSQVYALGLIILPPLIYIGTVFTALNMLRGIYIYSIGSQILRILILFILGWQWKTWGLVVGSVLSYALSTLYGLVIWEIESRRLLKAK